MRGRRPFSFARRFRRETAANQPQCHQAPAVTGSALRQSRVRRRGPGGEGAGSCPVLTPDLLVPPPSRRSRPLPPPTVASARPPPPPSLQIGVKTPSFGACGNGGGGGGRPPPPSSRLSPGGGRGVPRARGGNWGTRGAGPGGDGGGKPPFWGRGGPPRPPHPTPPGPPRSRPSPVCDRPAGSEGAEPGEAWAGRGRRGRGLSGAWPGAGAGAEREVPEQRNPGRGAWRGAGDRGGGGVSGDRGTAGGRGVPVAPGGVPGGGGVPAAAACHRPEGDRPPRPPQY